MKDERNQRERQTEASAMEWVGKENPDCDSAEHWFYMQCKAFRAGAEWADANPTTTADDEKAAQANAFYESINSAFDLAQKLKNENCPGVSFPVIHMIVRSARKDMVPAAEAEELKGILRGVPRPSDVLSMIDEAVKAERERCAYSADLMKHDLSTGETWDEALSRHKHRIMNPTDPTRSRETESK